MYSEQTKIVLRLYPRFYRIPKRSDRSPLSRIGLESGHAYAVNEESVVNEGEKSEVHERSPGGVGPSLLNAPHGLSC